MLNSSNVNISKNISRDQKVVIIPSNPQNYTQFNENKIYLYCCLLNFHQIDFMEIIKVSSGANTQTIEQQAHFCIHWGLLRYKLDKDQTETLFE